jgi:uncharacterized repeat protein (TIGR03803 family)
MNRTIKIILFFIFSVGPFLYAQYTKLFDFITSENGQNPQAALITDGTFLYGMTNHGGARDQGVIFKIKPDGTGYFKIHEFSDTISGSYPQGSLIYDGTFLYGMTPFGGIHNMGTIFRVKPDGTGFSKLFDFSGVANGSNPRGSLLLEGNYLFGMAQNGGSNNFGIIFKIKLDGSNFSKLLNFNDSLNGKYPEGSLISDGTFLYGMTTTGGTNSNGTIFKILHNGTGYFKLFDFEANSSGSSPNGSLVFDGVYLFGMTEMGDTNSRGNIFKIKTDGTGFTKLLAFGNVNNGTFPNGSLFLNGSYLYGMTCLGGTNGDGIIFKIKTDGTGYSKFLDFGGALGGRPYFASFIFDGNFLYGLTYYGGVKGGGVLFKIKTDGSGYSIVFDFGFPPNGNNPTGSLFSDGIFLYGMTSGGGDFGNGVLFKIKSDGTGFTKLFEFSGANGSTPLGSLISDGTFLYGLTSSGGTYGRGTIFKILPDGTGFSTLLDLNDSLSGSSPQGSLLYDGTFLYGMTRGGGSHLYGTLFRIKPDGSGFKKLHEFGNSTDGKSPCGSLFTDGLLLYGMTLYGGLYSCWHCPGYGTIFKIKPDGTGYKKIFDFNGSNGQYPTGSFVSDGNFLYGSARNIFKIQKDGLGQTILSSTASSRSELLYDGTFLYGLAAGGGSNNLGYLFKLMPDGSGFLNLMNFTGLDGSNPYGSLILENNFLYGMTSKGGVGNLGTVFKYHPAGIGITENEIQNEVFIYPNPASDLITLETKISLNNATLTVYNSLGQQVDQQSNITGSTILFQRNNLSQGFYVLKITQENTTISTRKIMFAD